MIAILFFGPIYLFGVFAFWQHAWASAVSVDDDGNPITAKIIQFPPRGEALPFHSRPNAKGSNRVVRADFNPSRGGNA